MPLWCDKGDKLICCAFQKCTFWNFKLEIPISSSKLFIESLKLTNFIFIFNEKTASYKSFVCILNFILDIHEKTSLKTSLYCIVRIVYEMYYSCSSIDQALDIIFRDKSFENISPQSLQLLTVLLHL